MPQCCVCYEDFTRADVNDRLVGRQLSCGHEACTTCLEDVFDDGEICCPECFASTETASVEALPSVDADEAAVSEPAVADFAPAAARAAAPASKLSSFLSATPAAPTKQASQQRIQFSRARLFRQLVCNQPLGRRSSHHLPSIVCNCHLTCNMQSHHLA